MWPKDPYHDPYPHTHLVCEKDRPDSGEFTMDLDYTTLERRIAAQFEDELKSMCPPNPNFPIYAVHPPKPAVEEPKKLPTFNLSPY